MALTEEQINNSPVLDRERHARLLLNIENFCKVAGIDAHQHLLAESAKMYCGNEDLLWFENYRNLLTNQAYGMLYVGGAEGLAKVPVRMMALTAAFMRNYIDARVMSLNEAIDYHKSEGLDCTVLMITNFMAKGEVDKKYDWKSEVLYDLLVFRQKKGLQTVLSIPKLEDTKSIYGAVVEAHLKNYFVQVSV